MADHGTSWKRPFNGQTAVVTYRALVGVLLSVIGVVLMMMWNDIVSRQQKMGDKIDLMEKTESASSVMLTEHSRRLDQIDGDARALSTRVNDIETRLPAPHN